jgi:hypothetical protein
MDEATRYWHQYVKPYVTLENVVLGLALFGLSVILYSLFKITPKWIKRLGGLVFRFVSVVVIAWGAPAIIALVQNWVIWKTLQTAWGALFTTNDSFLGKLQAYF